MPSTKILLILFLFNFSLLFGNCKNDVFTVDGINGNISYPKTYMNKSYSPGDSVTIKVKNANLLYYNFFIVTGSLKIKKIYSSIGDNTAFKQVEQQKSGLPDGVRDANILPKTCNVVDKDYDKDEIIEEIAGFINEQLWEIDTLKNIVNPILFEINYNNYTIYNCLSTDSTWSNATITRTNPARLNDSFRKLSKIFANVVFLKQSIIRLNAFDSSKIHADLYKGNIDSLISGLNNLKTDMENARNELIRRYNIIINNPIPMIELKIKIDQESQQYFFRIYRKKINEDPKNNDTSAIAVITIEGHSRSWLNYSMGLANIFQPNSSYQFYNKPDNDTTFYIQEDKSERQKAIPYLSIGFYLTGPVDEFNDNLFNGIMLLIGTEISTSPRYFMLGLNADFSIGCSFGFGITSYKRTVLSDGWSTDKVIYKTLHTNLNGTVPIKNEFAVGWFINLGFRPEIFKFFKKLIS